jgi:hypothetical protein
MLRLQHRYQAGPCATPCSPPPPKVIIRQDTWAALPGLHRVVMSPVKDPAAVDIGPPFLHQEAPEGLLACVWREHESLQAGQPRQPRCQDPSHGLPPHPEDGDRRDLAYTEGLKPISLTNIDPPHEPSGLHAVLEPSNRPLRHIHGDTARHHITAHQLAYQPTVICPDVRHWAPRKHKVRRGCKSQ